MFKSKNPKSTLFSWLFCAIIWLITAILDYSINNNLWILNLIVSILFFASSYKEYKRLRNERKN